MRDKSIQIICCGHAAWDMNFMMDGFPLEDQKYMVEKLVQSGGGPAANASCLLAKWGITTAAGDIFHGAFSYGILMGYPLEKNLRLASAAAAVSVSREGGKPSIPDYKEAEELFYTV